MAGQDGNQDARVPRLSTDARDVQEIALRPHLDEGLLAALDGSPGRIGDQGDRVVSRCLVDVEGVSFDAQPAIAEVPQPALDIAGRQITKLHAQGWFAVANLRREIDTGTFRIDREIKVSIP